jgi:hypothetical protein
MFIQRGAQRRWEEWFAKSPLQITPPTSHEFCKSPLPPLMSSLLDQDRVTPIEVSIVCMKRSVSTRYVPFKKMLTCGMEVGLWRRWHGENPYMWDLENFMTTWNTIFEKMLTCGTLLNFVTTRNTLCFKIMLTCGTDVGLWCIFRAYVITK